MLAEIRRRGGADDGSPSTALVVAVAGPDRSRHVARELEAVVKALGPESDVLRDERATCAAVRAALPTCRLLHFIGHAYQDLANPALGGLRLADGSLTALELAATRLGPAELAYLSACEGAAGGVAALDDPLPPAVACLAEGFRQVIGTLWSVGDLAAADVAERFYHRWSSGTPDTVAEALHATMREIRSAHPPTIWAAYIHLGG
jgi:CHAT domain-containing protein